MHEMAPARGQQPAEACLSCGPPLYKKMVIASAVDRTLLEDIFANRILVARIPNFYDPTASLKLADALNKYIDNAADGGIYESDISSYWAAAQEPAKLDTYFAAALPLLARLRQLSAPRPSPIDLLRMALDEAWPSGACLMSIAGRKMPFGLTRLWRNGSEALPHQDVIWREATDHPSMKAFCGQVGANIYLETAVGGGELEAWDYVVSDSSYQAMQQDYPGSYGYPRAILPDQSILVSPQVGDLILVNSLHVHAVRKIDLGRRITLSGFIAAATEDQPLRFWS